MESTDEDVIAKTNEHKSVKLKKQPCDYANMTNHDLIQEIKRLNSHVTQLKALFEKSQHQNDGGKLNKPVPNERTFDFNRFNKRHVLLKFAYLGWDYKGFTTQEGTWKTIENVLFNALTRTKLIVDRQSSNYHRCGRTDKGVSAFCQVISIDLRSNCADGIGLIKNPDSTVTNTDINKELNYLKYLNGVLPDDIRMLAWAPVKEDFSARFDCKTRIYRYYFPKGDLDLNLMKQAAEKFKGEHDFRNFCYMDVANGVVQFFRRINNISFNQLGDANDIYSMVELIIEGSSFLWHQIRAMTAVLFLVGQRKEEPSIIDELLNVNEWPCKPHYNITSEVPLVLFDCQYENLDWIYDRSNLDYVIKNLQDQWLEYNVKSTAIKCMIDSLVTKISDSPEMTDSVEKNQTKVGSRTLQQPYANLQGRSRPSEYIKLSKRKVVKSLEDRVQYYVKRKKIDEDLTNNKLAQAVMINKKLEEKYASNDNNNK